MINIPNTLTALRIALIPCFCVLFFMGADYYVYAGVLLIISGFSDMFDGMLARKLHQETELGKLLDPIADKLTLAGVVICMWYIYHKQFPILTFALGIMLVKELFMALGGIIIVGKGYKLIKAQWWGKVSTVIFYVNMILIVMLNILFDSDKLAVIVPAFAFIAAGAMLFALAMYFRMAIKIINGEEVSGTINLTKNKLKE